MKNYIVRLHLKALQRISTIPCDDCETPDECEAEGECAIENGEDE
jgi:hypothetical protein